MDEQLRPLAGVMMSPGFAQSSAASELSATLNRMGIAYEIRSVDAGDSPHLATAYASTAKARGLEVLIVGLGLSADLTVAVTLSTLLPVIALPEDESALNKLLLAVVNGAPVGVAGVGRDGAAKAALFAGTLLGASHPEIAHSVETLRATLNPESSSRPELQEN
jgi:phosphoribosylaminoimidazole carboxylase PurE protein